MKIVGSASMQEIDRRAQDEYGIPSLVLMEAAGLLAWQELSTLLSDTALERDRAVCFVCGKGNNGGDALVMARYAAVRGVPATVVLAVPAEELGEQAAIHARSVRKLGVPVFTWQDEDARVATCASAKNCASAAIAAAAVIVDGLSGTGVRGALRAPLDAICEAMNSATARVVAVDAPSGLSDEWRPGMPVVQADWTLTMGLPKTCLYEPHGRLTCGEIRTVGVPFPPALIADEEIPGELLGPGDLPPLLGPLPAGSYKHRRGVVSVFAGNEGTSGAAVLAAEGAARCRAGLVTIHVDRSIYPLVASSVRSIMARPLVAESLESVAADAVVIGPGWGQGAERAELLRRLVGLSSRGVIDADGLNLIARGPAMKLCDHWVFTPHPGELARLLGKDARTVTETFIESVRECSRRYGTIVVGKSHTSVIAHPDGRYAIVDGLNPALGTGGSGDVLAGAIAGLLAAGGDPWTAARAAVLAHQVAGRALRERSGIFLAEELPAEIGRIVDVRPGLQ